MQFHTWKSVLWEVSIEGEVLELDLIQMSRTSMLSLMVGMVLSQCVLVGQVPMATRAIMMGIGSISNSM